MAAYPLARMRFPGRDLVFTVGRQEVAREEGGFTRRRRCGIEVDKAAPKLGELFGDHSRAAPERSLLHRDSGRRLRRHRLAAPGHEPQPWEKRPCRLEQCLQHVVVGDGGAADALLELFEGDRLLVEELFTHHIIDIGAARLASKPELSVSLPFQLRW